MNILSANTVSSKAKSGIVIGNFSHAGASGGQFVLDAEAQVFFSVNASNQLVWSPVAGISIMTGSYPITVSAIFSGYDAEDSQFIIQVTA
jgi:glutamate synthase domain-containing protein 3